eukprot:12466150-Ditylum_brightwellii.AAC.1
MIASDYGVKKKPITARNPQVHGTSIDEKDPWTGIFGALRFATRATVHTTMQATPMQLVFGRDAI